MGHASCLLDLWPNGTFPEDVLRLFPVLIYQLAVKDEIAPLVAGGMTLQTVVSSALRRAS